MDTDFSTPCRCRSGIDFARCCAVQPLAPVALADRFPARDAYASMHAEVTRDGAPASTTALHATALTVWQYLESREEDPRFRRYFLIRDFYETIVRNVHAPLVEADEDVAVFIMSRSSFDLRVYPERRSPAAIFLQVHGRQLPLEARQALRAQIRALDEAVRITRSRGRTYLTRLRDGRRLESAFNLMPEANWYLGRLVEFGGRFHTSGAGQFTETPVSRWRRLTEYAVDYYSNRLSDLPRHTDPGKTVLLGLFLAADAARHRHERESTPEPDPREVRRWLTELRKDPAWREAEEEVRRDFSRMWCDLPEPALGNTVPRQLLDTPGGRQRLEEHLAAREGNRFLNQPPLDVRVARRRLKLPPPASARKRHRHPPDSDAES